MQEKMLHKFYVLTIIVLCCGMSFTYPIRGIFQNQNQEDLIMSNMHHNVLSSDIWSNTEVVSTESTSSSIDASCVIDAGRTLHVVWRDATNYSDSGTDSDVFYKCKPSGGDWSLTEVVTANSTKPINYPPKIAVQNDGTVHIVWSERLLSGGADYDVFYKKKENGIWGNQELVSSESRYRSIDPNIDVGEDGTVHVIWRDDSTLDSSRSDYDIFYKTKKDGIWSTTEEITADIPNHCNSPSVKVGYNGTVHVIWCGQPTGSYYDVFYKYKLEDGNWIDPINVSKTPAETSAKPTFAVDTQGRIHVTWYEEPTPSIDNIYYSLKEPNGVFSEKVLISSESDNVGAEPDPNIAVGSDGTVHITWKDRTNLSGAGEDMDIFYKKKQNDIWSTTEVVSTESMGYWTNAPSISVGSDNLVHIVWRDETNYSGCGEDNDIVYKNRYPDNLIIVDDDFSPDTPGWGETRFNVIQEAIDSAVEDTKIYVNSGIYFENVVVNKKVHLIGENKETTIIDGQGIGDVVTFTTDKINLSGFTIQNSSSGWYNAGIYLDNSDNNYITDTIINNNLNGIYLELSYENTFFNNKIHHNNWYGFHLNLSGYNTIDNNNISSNYAYGVLLKRSGSNTISNCTIMDNQNGVYVREFSHRTTINNNFVSLCNNGIGLYDHCQWCDIIGNKIINNGMGVYIWDNCNQNNILNNNVSFNDNKGIHIYYNTYNTISRNIITDNGFFGVDLQYCFHTIVYNNYFKNNFNARDDGTLNTWNISRTEGKNIINGSFLGGNYWSDYTGLDDGSGLYPHNISGDGIGDTELPYNSQGEIQFGGDMLPLISSFDYQVYNVRTEKNFETIQQAIDDPETIGGDTILVNSGVYYENVVIDKSLNIMGFDKDTTIIDGSNSGNVVEITVDNVNLSGFTIRNAGPGLHSESGIHVTSDHNIIADNNISSNPGDGIYLFYANYNNITNNFQTNNKYSIYSKFSNYNTIKDNLIIFNTIDSVRMDFSDHNNIINNNLSNNPYHGVHLVRSYYNDIIYNNISYDREGIYFDNAHQNTISKNNITFNNRYGIYLQNSDGNTIPNDNYFYGNGNDMNKKFSGIRDGPEGNGIGSAIILDNSSNNIIKEATFVDNNYGIYVYNSSNGNIIYHNNFLENNNTAFDENSNTWSYEGGGNFWDDFELNPGYPDYYAIPGGDNTDDNPLPEPWTPTVCICGDANNDAAVNVGDAVFLINYIFKGGPAPSPEICCGDANSDGQVNVGDAVYLINYIFKGGPPPVDDCC